jgi:hypothetical protein
VSAIAAHAQQRDPVTYAAQKGRTSGQVFGFTLRRNRQKVAPLRPVCRCHLATFSPPLRGSASMARAIPSCRRQCPAVSNWPTMRRTFAAAVPARSATPARLLPSARSRRTSSPGTGLAKVICRPKDRRRCRRYPPLPPPKGLGDKGIGDQARRDEGSGTALPLAGPDAHPPRSAACPVAPSRRSPTPKEPKQFPAGAWRASTAPRSRSLLVVDTTKC